MPAIKMYIEKFGKEVLIDDDHELVIAQRALNAKKKGNKRSRVEEPDEEDEIEEPDEEDEIEEGADEDSDDESTPEPTRAPAKKKSKKNRRPRA